MISEIKSKQGLGNQHYLPITDHNQLGHSISSFLCLIGWPPMCWNDNYSTFNIYLGLVKEGRELALGYRIKHVNGYNHVCYVFQSLAYLPIFSNIHFSESGLSALLSAQAILCMGVSGVCVIDTERHLRPRTKQLGHPSNWSIYHSCKTGSTACGFELNIIFSFREEIGTNQSRA